MSPFKAAVIQRGVLVAMCLLFCGGFVVLAAGLYRVQVRDEEKHIRSFERQSIRRIRTAPSRGPIFDKFGVCLAENRPSYDIVVYVEELRVPGPRARTVEIVNGRLNDLSAFLGLALNITTDDITSHLVRETSLPLDVWRDISADTLARFMESQHLFPGSDVSVSSVRVYPMGELAAHVVGYVKRADPVHDNAGFRYSFFLPDTVGRSGVEQQYNEELAGTPGVRMLRCDAIGYKYELLTEVPAKPGEALRLTLDTRVQRVAENMLMSEQGAAIVLDVTNGDVLALASVPSFDLNLFVPGISQDDWDRLLQDPGTPLFNRATHSGYSPGSVYKPIVALAALESRMYSGEEIITCPGYYLLGRRRIACWRRTGHGPLSMRQSIEHSCNTYFIDIGHRMGIDVINGMARQFGFGKRTGIDLPSERPGLLPDDAWRAGDTCNVAIGQGFLQATPLQIARMTAAIANGGYLFRPRLVAPNGAPGILERRIHLSRHSLDVVRWGMRDVVDKGTGRSAAIPGVAVAGKTGSAEYGPGNAKTLAWMVAYAPFDQPRYAVVVVLEDAKKGGGTDAGPRVREILRTVLTLDGTLEAPN